MSQSNDEITHAVRSALSDDPRRPFQGKAFDHVTSLRGVTGVTNDITVDQRLP